MKGLLHYDQEVLFSYRVKKCYNVHIESEVVCMLNHVENQTEGVVFS